jgi:hypothetical protein
MRIFQAAYMSEKRHASSRVLPAPPPGHATATCGCLACGKGFQPLFSIVVYNEKSSFWLSNA